METKIQSYCQLKIEICIVLGSPRVKRYLSRGKRNLPLDFLDEIYLNVQGLKGGRSFLNSREIITFFKY